ncbi:MAG: glutathione S-transferase [Alphaproteobacteria bacterium]|nr:glutathione S-transferase [Alphaproteobacteria bacterium]
MTLQLLIANKNYSSWSVRPWLVLRHFGIPFEARLGRLLLAAVQNDDATETITDWSAAGRVPVLRDGDLTVWESLAIIEYLADTYPGAGIWPKDPKQRARARAVSAEMHAGFGALRSEMPMNTRRRYERFPVGDACMADIERSKALWTDCFDRSGGPFLFGAFCGADAMFAPVVSRFRTYAVPLEGRCAEYADAVWALPTVKEWLEEAAAEPGRIPMYEF